ncbi:hypothetical protein AB431_04390 [Mycobacterium sp. EPa45]|nr:hypothetical protein AB431_04390 [Mycobacterium sp. EPa45]
MDVVEQRIGHECQMNAVIDDPESLRVVRVLTINLKPKAMTTLEFGYSIARFGAAMSDTVAQEVRGSLARSAIEARQGYQLDRVTFAMSTRRGQDLPGISIGVEI